MKKFLDWITGLLLKIPAGHLCRFVFGVLAAVVALLVLRMYVCGWPALFLGFLAEMVLMSRSNKFQWWGLLSTVVGGAVVQILVFLCMSPDVPFIVH